MKKTPPIEFDKIKINPNTVATIVVIVVIISAGYVFFDEIKKMFGLGGDDPGKGTAEAAASTVSTLEKENRVAGLPKPNSRHQMLANQIYRALNQFVNTDENAIYKAFEGSTPTDVKLIVEAYGARRLTNTPYHWMLLNKDTLDTLPNHLKLVLDAKEYERVRPWMIVGGFDYYPKK